MATLTTKGTGNGRKTRAPKSFQYKMVSVEALTPAPYNPPHRVSTKAIRELRDSIEQFGLIYPVLATKDLQLIEGHRRVAAFKELGFPAIPAIILDQDPDEVYAQVNSTQKKLNGYDALGVYLQNPHAVAGTALRRIRFAEDLVGKPTLREIYAKGFAADIVGRARLLMNYCGDASPDKVCRCVRWMLDHGMNFRVRAVIDVGTPAGRIVKAIEEDKPLRVQFSE